MSLGWIPDFEKNPYGLTDEDMNNINIFHTDSFTVQSHYAYVAILIVIFLNIVKYFYFYYKKKYDNLFITFALINSFIVFLVTLIETGFSVEYHKCAKTTWEYFKYYYLNCCKDQTYSFHKRQNLFYTYLLDIYGASLTIALSLIIYFLNNMFGTILLITIIIISSIIFKKYIKYDKCSNDKVDLKEDKIKKEIETLENKMNTISKKFNLIKNIFIPILLLVSFIYMILVYSDINNFTFKLHKPSGNWLLGMIYFLFWSSRFKKYITIMVFLFITFVFIPLIIAFYYFDFNLQKKVNKVVNKKTDTNSEFYIHNIDIDDNRIKQIYIKEIEGELFKKQYVNTKNDEVIFDGSKWVGILKDNTEENINTRNKIHEVIKEKYERSLKIYNYEHGLWHIFCAISGFNGFVIIFLRELFLFSKKTLYY